jgi:hypothetical protein
MRKTFKWIQANNFEQNLLKLGWIELSLNSYFNKHSILLFVP